MVMFNLNESAYVIYWLDWVLVFFSTFYFLVLGYMRVFQFKELVLVLKYYGFAFSTMECIKQTVHESLMMRSQNNYGLRRKYASIVSSILILVYHWMAPPADKPSSLRLLEPLTVWLHISSLGPSDFYKKHAFNGLYKWFGGWYSCFRVTWHYMVYMVHFLSLLPKLLPLSSETILTSVRDNLISQSLCLLYSYIKYR